VRQEVKNLPQKAKQVQQDEREESNEIVAFNRGISASLTKNDK